jgi:2'-5' RNA ligase
MKKNKKTTSRRCIIGHKFAHHELAKLKQIQEKVQEFLPSGFRPEPTLHTTIAFLGSQTQEDLAEILNQTAADRELVSCCPIQCQIEAIECLSSGTLYLRYSCSQPLDGIEILRRVNRFGEHSEESEAKDNFLPHISLGKLKLSQGFDLKKTLAKLNKEILGNEMELEVTIRSLSLYETSGGAYIDITGEFMVEGF